MYLKWQCFYTYYTIIYTALYTQPAGLYNIKHATYSVNGTGFVPVIMLIPVNVPAVMCTASEWGIGNIEDVWSVRRDSKLDIDEALYIPYYSPVVPSWHGACSRPCDGSQLWPSPPCHCKPVVLPHPRSTATRWASSDSYNRLSL